MFIVIQKPNSNKVFLSYLILYRTKDRVTRTHYRTGINGQYRDTGNIDHTTQNENSEKHNAKKKMSNTTIIKKTGVSTGSRDG